MKKKYTPHLGHFSLVEACAESGCPICFISEKAIKHYLAMILYDYVDDPDLREQLCDAWGYCHKHAWMLPGVERGNLLTVAVMYQDILDREIKKTLAEIDPSKGDGFLQRLISGVFKRKKHDDSAQPFSLEHSCPGCELADEIEENAIKIMLKAFAKEDKEIQKALRDSDGLCVPHLSRAFQLAQNKAVRELLLTLAQEKLTDIQAELSEFIRKHDYRFQHEPMGDEKTSWKRAINLIVGAE